MGDFGNKEVMANNIRYYLEKFDKKQVDICIACDFNIATFSHWMHGRTYPRIDKIEKMANYFGIQKSDLIERKKPVEELEKYYEMIQKKPQLRIILDSASELTLEDVGVIIKILDRFKTSREE